MIVWGEAHLRHVLKAYTAYYNGTRTHLGIDKEAPNRRAIDRCGGVAADAVLGALHHRYAQGTQGQELRTFYSAEGDCKVYHEKRTRQLRFTPTERTESELDAIDDRVGPIRANCQTLLNSMTGEQISPSTSRLGWEQKRPRRYADRRCGGTFGGIR
jgi:hypothetical protein